jgi:hypothetical protein
MAEPFKDEDDILEGTSPLFVVNDIFWGKHAIMKFPNSLAESGKMDCCLQ